MAGSQPVRERTWVVAEIGSIRQAGLQFFLSIGIWVSPRDCGCAHMSATRDDEVFTFYAKRLCRKLMRWRSFIAREGSFPWQPSGRQAWVNGGCLQMARSSLR